MKITQRISGCCWRFIVLALTAVTTALAQDPWTASANNLKTAFTGPIVTALIAVAVVITGMTFAFSEGQGKRQLTGLLSAERWLSAQCGS